MTDLFTTSLDELDPEIAQVLEDLFASQIGGVVEEVMSGAYHDAESFVAQIAE